METVRTTDREEPDDFTDVLGTIMSLSTQAEMLEVETLEAASTAKKHAKIWDVLVRQAAMLKRLAESVDAFYDRVGVPLVNEILTAEQKQELGL